MREIVLDTETTGLDPLRGDRLVEIGCIEIYNRMPTGQTFHRYINPQRDMPAEAFAVHGLSAEFLTSKPLFTEVVEEYLEFFADARLLIRLLRPGGKHQGVSNRRNDHCSVIAINNPRRTKHGALLDAELLAEV